MSVGALNGAFLVDRAGQQAVKDKDQPVNWKSIGKELTSFWTTNITSPDKLVDTRSGVSIVWDTLFNNFDGLVDTAALQALVKGQISVDNLRAAKPQLMVGYVNLANGQLKYADASFPNIVDYVIGSTAIPIAMPIKMVGDAPLVDGGTIEIAPLGRAINAGATEIACIVCQAEDVGGAAFDRKNLMQLVSRVMDIVTNATVENDLKQVQYVNDLVSLHKDDTLGALLKNYRNIPVTLVRPSAPINVEIDTFTTSDIQEMIKEGRYAAQHATQILAAKLQATP